jgi:hypothetical protein
VYEAPGLTDRQPFGNTSPTIRYQHPREHLQGRSLVKGMQSLLFISLPLSISRMYLLPVLNHEDVYTLSNEEEILLLKKFDFMDNLTQFLSPT